MKKNIRIWAAALLIFSLSACTNVERAEISESSPTQIMNTVVSEIEREDQAESPASSSESKKSDVSSQAPVSPTKRQKSTPKPAEKKKEKQSVQKEDSSAVHTTEPPKQDISTPKPQPKVQAAATPAPTPAPTPVPTPIPTQEPPSPTQEPVEPTPEPVQEPSFDIGYWVGYAQSYATGVGLTLESSAVDCWDNPIGAGPHSTCLERDISSRLNRYANDPDITDVWIWYESAGGGSYNIYIGYA